VRGGDKRVASLGRRSHILDVLDRKRALTVEPDP
jgi:antitoxin component HigA of HigAB toxin-antitoxin module